MLRIGDKVMWRGGFGYNAPREAVVRGIEVGCVNKMGRNVEEVEWDEVCGRGTILDLENGHWAYGEQITRVKQNV